MFKKLTLRLALVAGILLPAAAFAQTGKPVAAKAPPSKTLDLKVRIKNLKDTICLLANYYGDKQFIQDTAKVDANGNMVFKNKEAMPRGIYLIVLPNKKYFEIVLTDEQHFSLETDTANLIGNMVVTGSVENKNFYDYLKYIGDVQKKADPMREKKKALEAAGKKDSVELLQKQMDEVDKQVKQYKLDFMTNHPDDFMTKVFNAMKDPEVPEAPKNPDGSKDSTFAFRYYKQHFFDGMDWKDDGMVRTPVYFNKISQYLDKLTPQHPDSIMVACDFLIEKARPSKELFKFTTHHCTYKYETSKVMCFDKIFVHLVDKYYKTNQAFWLTPEQLEKITKRADQLRYSICGANPANMTLLDTLDHTFQLQDIKAKYTIIAFWDPGCSHCQKEIPILKTEYDKLKAEGIDVAIFTILTEDDIADWKKFIRTNQLNWYNGRAKDQQERALYKYYYDIFSTPVLYLLDDKKQIIAKRLDPDQMADMIRKKDGKKVEPREPKKTGTDKPGTEPAANSKEKEYTDFMTKANTAFGLKKYEEAKSLYQSALGRKAGDKAASDGVAKCDIELKKKPQGKNN